MSWRLLTNHGRMLLCLTSEPGLRIRDLAVILGITERSAQKIITDLVGAGYVTRKRIGRRNEYEVHVEMPLRVGRELTVRDMLETFRPQAPDREPGGEGDGGPAGVHLAS